VGGEVTHAEHICARAGSLIRCDRYRLASAADDGNGDGHLTVSRPPGLSSGLRGAESGRRRCRQRRRPLPHGPVSTSINIDECR
jgi:hypothetical protein